MKCVRIDELEFRYSPLYNSQILHVKRPLPVDVRTEGTGNTRRPKTTPRRGNSLFFKRHLANWLGSYTLIYNLSTLLSQKMSFLRGNEALAEPALKHCCAQGYRLRGNGQVYTANRPLGINNGNLNSATGEELTMPYPIAVDPPIC